MKCSANHLGIITDRYHRGEDWRLVISENTMDVGENAEDDIPDKKWYCLKVSKLSIMWNTFDLFGIFTW